MLTAAGSAVSLAVAVVNVAQCAAADHGRELDYEPAATEQNSWATGSLGGAAAYALRTVDKTVPTLAAGASPAAQPAQQSSDHPLARLWQPVI